MKVAVIGSTGVVGNVMLSLLESRDFPLSDLIPVASERSVGKKILFNKEYYNIVSIEDAIKMKLEAGDHKLRVYRLGDIIDEQTIVADQPLTFQYYLKRGVITQP